MRSYSIRLSLSNLISLSIVFSRSIHVVANDKISFFLWLIFHCARIPHLLYPFIRQFNLGCFDILVIVNSARMNLEVHVSFQISVFSICNSSTFSLAISPLPIWPSPLCRFGLMHPKGIKALIVSLKTTGSLILFFTFLVLLITVTFPVHNYTDPDFSRYCPCGFEPESQFLEKILMGNLNIWEL